MKYLISKNDLLQQLAVLLKAKGFKKNKQTWYKRENGIVQVLNVQNSQWDTETYYINFGLQIEALNQTGKPQPPSFSNCHIRDRFSAYEVSLETVTAGFEHWLDTYGTVEKLGKQISEINRSMLVPQTVITFLSSGTSEEQAVDHPEQPRPTSMPYYYFF